MHTCICTHTVSLVHNFGSNILAKFWKKNNLQDALRFYFLFLLMYEIIFPAKRNLQILIFGVSKA